MTDSSFSLIDARALRERARQMVDSGQQGRLYCRDAHPVIRDLTALVDQLHKDLAECYKATGADHDGNEDWRLAPDALQEVQLRLEYDVADDQLTEEAMQHHYWQERALKAEARLSLQTAALQKRLKAGHNDTCDFMLSSEYPCSCGHDDLAAVVKGAPE